MDRGYTHKLVFRLIIRIVDREQIIILFYLILQTTPSLTNESHIPLTQKANFTQKFNCQQTNAKLAPTPNLIHDSQSLANHNDLSQRFVTNGPSNSQYAQPTVFIPTSSGLLLTTALPAMITSQLSNIQSLNQQMPPLHQFNQQAHAENKSGGDKSSIGLSMEKRQLVRSF